MFVFFFLLRCVFIVPGFSRFVVSSFMMQRAPAFCRSGHAGFGFRVVQAYPSSPEFEYFCWEFWVGLST